MKEIKYSSLGEEAKEYWKWSRKKMIPKIPYSVAREGAGSEERTPIMHYGTVMPVYLTIIRYLRKIKPKKNSKLIELGCGTGRVLSYIKHLFPNIQVSGIDYSKGAINYANKHYKKLGVIFKNVNAKNTYLQNNSYDFVISSHAIEHINKKEGLKFMDEVKRLLKKGGYAFIGTPERKKCQNIYCQNIKDIKKLRFIPPHEHEYTLQELKKLAINVFGKRNVKVDRLNNPLFYKIFSSRINLIKPDKNILNIFMNFLYRIIRDIFPRPLFDIIGRIGTNIKMKSLKIDYSEILKENIVLKEGVEIADNLLLVCKK